jgi:hypothetical protein
VGGLRERCRGVGRDGPRLPRLAVVYLAGLCAMAAVGALLSATRQRLPLLVVGTVLTFLPGVAGWAALP